MGPLLFLIYINDIYKTSSKFKFYLFADDTNLLYANKNIRLLETIVNTELEKLHTWVTVNKPLLNIKKKILLSFVLIRKSLMFNLILKYMITRVINILISIYHSLIQPYLSYGLCVWRQASILLKNQTHAIPFFIETNMSSINILYFEEIAILMHNVVNDKMPKMYQHYLQIFLKFIPTIHEHQNQKGYMSSVVG